MIRSRLSRIFALQIRRLRLYYYLIVFIFFLTILFFYFRASKTDRIINDFSTSKTEWSTTEHSAFFNWFLAEFEIEKNFQEESKAGGIDTKMEKILKGFQNEIYENLQNKVKKPGYYPVSNGSTLVSVDRLDYDSVLDYLEIQTLKNLSLDQLNLIVGNKPPDYLKAPDGTYANIKCSFLENKDDSQCESPKSFVLFPTQLVYRDENYNPLLPIQLKRELVFSKYIEKYLLEVLEKVPEAGQAYFIPISGFLRICRKGIENPIEYYNDKFYFKQDFADRLNFKSTMEKEFHIAPLYVDSGGGGIVRTYSIAIISHDLGVVGMIGVDVQIGSAEKQFLDKSQGFFPFLKNPMIDICNVEDTEKTSEKNQFSTKYDILTPSDKKGIIGFKEASEKKSKNQNLIITKLMRINFDSNGDPINDAPGDSKKISRIIYSLPLEGKKLAFFIFDKERMMWQNVVFASFLIIILVFFTLLIKLVYDQMINRVREEEKKLDLITHMHSSYVITDKANRIQTCNEEFENLVEDKNAIGRNFTEYLTRDSRKDFKFFLDSGKERFEFPVVIKSRSGNESSAILINAKTSYHLDRKARISILIELENLESMVAEKYADRISHILKSPLHSILQIADQLRRKTARPRYEDYFRVLEVEIAVLKGEISRLLDMQKIEYKPLEAEFSKVDLTKLVKEIKGEYVPLIEKKKLGFNSNFAEGVSLTADRNMVKVAVENILDNALKYTRIGSLSFNLFDSPADVKIVVSDTGIGIPADEISRIFQKNYRGRHPVVQTSPGKGTGLYLCNNFIDIHKGRLEVKSVVGKGSKFTVILPKHLKESKGD